MVRPGPKPNYKITDRDRLRRKAHDLVAEAITEGLIPHPTAFKCTDCDAVADCYDHRDYRRPLRIKPVCKGCNNRRGPGRPFPEKTDNSEYKLDSPAGHRWANFDGGGDGYEPLAARLLIDAPEAMNESDINASFWRPNRFFQHAELGEKSWKARADWFKARDPWC